MCGTRSVGEGGRLGLGEVGGEGKPVKWEGEGWGWERWVKKENE